MTATIKDGVARINAGYTLKLPNPEVAYSSQDQHLGISIEFAVEDDADFDALLDDLVEREARLASEVKLAVFAQLGVKPKEITEGVLAPDLGDFDTGKDSSKSSSTNRRGSRSNSGRGGKSRGGSNTSNGSKSRGGNAGRRPKTSSAQRDDLPVVGPLTVPHPFDEGEIIEDTFVDYRPLKRSGDFQPRAFDFKQENGNISLWMANKDGTPNDEVLDALDEAGVEYEWDEFN